MKTFAEHVSELSKADRKMLGEAASRLVHEPVFRLIFDGLMAHALQTVATIRAEDTNQIRKWQERYQALKQLDIELRNFEASIPKEKLRVV